MASRNDASIVYTTTFLVTNIHCPSCVSYATDVLSSVSNAIQKIDTSIIDHTIRVQHIGDISAMLLEELIDAAFEVEHISVTDTAGQTLQDREVCSTNATQSPAFVRNLFMSKAQKKHIKNCKACQEDKSKESTINKTWSRIHWRRRSPSRTDLERGILRSKSLSISPDTTTVPNGDDPRDVVDIQDNESEYTVIFAIEGMTCASCVSSITNALQQESHTVTANVNLLANNATVTFHGPRAAVGHIKECIEDVGFNAQIEEIRSLKKSRVSDDLLKASISVDGMTCGSCVGSIKRGLTGLHGVHEVHVELLSNSASVWFSGRANIDAILERIDDLGYDASLVQIEEADPSTQCNVVEERSLQFEIQGMYCPKCPSNIVTALEQRYQDNIQVIERPTLKQPRIEITYRPSPPAFTARSILDVINSVDSECSAVVYRPPSLEERSRNVLRKERNRILRHLFVTLVIAIPTFIIGIIYMSLVPATNQTRQWFEEPILSGNAMRIEWALLIMTTPVMLYGAGLFHTRAIREIWNLWRPRSKVPILRRFYRFGSMNLLISAGTSVAYFASLAVLIMDATTINQMQGTGRKSATYFDTVTFLTLFILIGRFLEAYSKARTGDAVSMLANLRPKTALLVDSTGFIGEKTSQQTTKKISVDLLEVGDIVSVPHGACPPTDGVVVQEGTFLFDESSLTGESQPAKKGLDDAIFTGSINVGNPVRVKVSKIGGKAMLDQIVNVVREGQTKRAPIERFADTLTGYFTPIITLLAIITWVIWLALGESGRLPPDWLDTEKGGWPYWTVEFAVAVFVVACPCGIGLAAPTALFVGGGLAAKNGILVQGGGQSFQEASKLDAIVFDKTGTLTQGRMTVTEVEFLTHDHHVANRDILAIAKALEDASTHPIAKAIVSYCDQELSADQGSLPVPTKIHEHPGMGMSGTVEFQIESTSRTYEVVIGNKILLHTMSDSPISSKNQDQSMKTSSKFDSDAFLSVILSRFQSRGNSTAVLAIRPLSSTNDPPTIFTPIAVLAIADPLREEAPVVISSLQSQGLEVYMCTGDNLQTALSVASQLSIPSTHIRAGVLPQDKASYIHELQFASSRRKVIAFVGDGTNDTPALTVSDVSVALSHPEGGGSDIALTSSSFVLLNSNLTSILTLVKLSKRVFLRVKMNFLWAAVYNLCLIPVAAGVFFPIGATWGNDAHGGFRLNPVWASVAMAGSSVSVVLSSLALRLPEVEAKRLMWWKRK